MKKLEEMKNVSYPNPYFVRKDYENLDGIWEFSFEEGEQEPAVFARLINVPFPYESKASFINDQAVHSSLWYRRKVLIKKHEGHLILHFGAVDYACIVYWNGVEIGRHVGGYTAFAFDITSYAHEGNNTLSLHVYDSLAKDQLRGKQRAKPTSYDCWYVQTSGIVQPVWLEYAGMKPLEGLRIQGDKEGRVSFAFTGPEEARTLEVFDADGNLIQSVATLSNTGSFVLPNPHLWSPDDPFVYYCRIRDDAPVIDVVESVFACRAISLEEDGIYLNGKKTYLRLVLSQGYWPDSLTTPPSLEALYHDAALVLSLGFNGVRVHQKKEVPNFYYMCDLLGILSWGEIPSAYAYDEHMKEELRRDIPLIQKELFNSPSIIVWLLFNESWGIPEVGHSPETQEFVRSILDEAKTYAGGRPLIANDGWNQLSETAICSLHEYEQNPEVLSKTYADKNQVVTLVNVNHYGPAFAEFNHYESQPIILSEFGGVALADSLGWGYGKKAEGTKAYEKRVQALFATVYSFRYLAGFCYTQLTDVQQESNGLLTADRKEKLPISEIAQIVKGVAA